jgi:hypothetical protein
MAESDIKPELTNNWKPQALILGGIIGTLLGLGAAYLLIQRAEKENQPLKLTAGEGIKLGLLALGTLRQITQLGGGEK